MSKGSGRRPCAVPRQQFEDTFESVFGPKKLNVMSDEDRQRLLDELIEKGSNEDLEDSNE